MKYQIAAHFEAPPQYMAVVTGPVDRFGDIYVTQRAYNSIEHAKTIIGTIQSRAERNGLIFHGGLIIPYGMVPPKDKTAYQVATPLKGEVKAIPEWENWELRSPYQKFYAAQELEHPETVIVPPNEFYPNGLREMDIVAYNDAMKVHIIGFYKKYDLDGFVLMKVDDKLVVKRHASIEIKGMKLDNMEAFDALNRGRTIEFHFAVGKTTKLIWLDLDPNPKFPWEDTKRITNDLAQAMENSKHTEGLVKDVQIRFSGKTGFHIIGELHSSIPTDEARNRVKALAEDYITDVKDDRLSTSVTKVPESMRIDYSTLHEAGGLRVPYSIAYPTGLVCSSVPIKSLGSFELDMSTIYTAMEKMGEIGKKAAEEFTPGSLDQIIRVWLKTKERVINREEATQLINTYHHMGFGKFYRHVNEILGHWIGEQDLYNALQGQAIVYELPLIFKAMSSNLTEYRHKRDFEKSSEPAGEGGIAPGDEPIYVIQEHDAERAHKHWDLRLEDAGVLKSWAIPKLPDLLGNKKATVLAVAVEDHPLAYKDFEGTIPKGQYGAGEVKIYASGTYTTVSRTIDKWTVDLTGGTIDGRYSLIRTDGNKWLLRKSK